MEQTRVSVAEMHDISAYLTSAGVISDFRNRSSSGNPVHELERSPVRLVARNRGYFHGSRVEEKILSRSPCQE